jgi:hypothetical protein
LARLVATAAANMDKMYSNPVVHSRSDVSRKDKKCFRNMGLSVDVKTKTIPETP